MKYTYFVSYNLIHPAEGIVGCGNIFVTFRKPFGIDTRDFLQNSKIKQTLPPSLDVCIMNVVLTKTEEEAK